MTEFRNTVDGPNGTALSLANSASYGNAFTAFAAAAGVTIAYSTTQAFRGSSSLALSSATFADTSFWEWNGVGATSGSVYHRFFLWPPGIGTEDGTFARIAQMLTIAAGGDARLLLGNTGVLKAGNAAGTEIAASLGTVPVVANQWNRIEWRVAPSTTAGEIEWRLYTSPFSTTPADSNLVTGQVLGANVGTVSTGPSGSTAPFGTGLTSYWDEPGASTNTWLGVADPVIPPTFNAIPFTGGVQSA